MKSYTGFARCLRNSVLSPTQARARLSEVHPWMLEMFGCSFVFQRKLLDIFVFYLSLWQDESILN